MRCKTLLSSVETDLFARIRIQILFVSLVCFSFLIPKSASAQDLIVTTIGDSLNCKIFDIDDDNIYLTIERKGKKINTHIPFTKVRDYLYDYYIITESPYEKLLKDPRANKIRIAVDCGYSYQTGKLDEDLNEFEEEYFRELKKGMHLGGEAAWYFSEYLGAGIKYDWCHANASRDRIVFTDEHGNQSYGDLSNTINMHYIGPYFTVRLMNETKLHSLVFNTGIGIMNYKDDGEVVERYMATGNTLSLAIDASGEFSISSYIAFGMKVSLLTGTLTRLTVDSHTGREIRDLESGQYIDLNRVQISAGLRVQLWRE